MIRKCYREIYVLVILENTNKLRRLFNNINKLRWTLMIISIAILVKEKLVWENNTWKLKAEGKKIDNFINALYPLKISLKQRK